MQFMAFGPYWAVVRSELEAVYDSKDRLTRPKQRRLFAKFDQGAAPAWVLELAAERFDLARIPAGSTLRKEVSFYDSILDQARMGWTDDERKLIEEKLLTRPSVVVVERPRAELPYRKYLAHRKVHGRRTVDVVVKDILAAVEAAGVDPYAVVAYENDNGDEHSEAIVSALLAAFPDEPADAQEVEEDEPLIAA